MSEIEIKKPKAKNLRRRKQSSSSDDAAGSGDEKTLQQVEEARLIREMKKKKHGIDILSAMPSGSDMGDHQETFSMDDPLRLKSGGGLANMNALRQMSSESAAATTSSIGTAFAAETKRRDEDLELLRYVEEEMNKRRGAGEERQAKSTPKSNNPKAVLFELPDYLKVQSKQKKKEENVSSQMLTGIPEVDLGIEAKMKNIEETEAAKQKLWEEMRGKQDDTSDFIPTNYAVNFVQHNRWANPNNRVAPNVQAAFVQAHARKQANDAEKAAEAAAAAAKIVVQISEPGSEGVGYIPPKPLPDPAKIKFNKPQKKHRKKDE